MARLVKHVRHSTIASELLEDDYKLVTACVPRWNMQLAMLRSVLKLKSSSLDKLDCIAKLKKNPSDKNLSILYHLSRECGKQAKHILGLSWRMAAAGRSGKVVTKRKQSTGRIITSHHHQTESQLIDEFWLSPKISRPIAVFGCGR